MRNTKKVLASLAIAGLALSRVPLNVFAESRVPTRIAGVTAEQTAVSIANQTGWTGTAILASSTSYGRVDALTAGPLATYLKAPILLTGAGKTLDKETKAELTKLEVKKVYVTSGASVISEGVIDEIKSMGITVEQLGGYDRFETCVNIANKISGVTKVAVANSIPDALSIASIAAAANQPILLTHKDAVPESVLDYLSDNPRITTSDIIGGTGVISDAVKAKFPRATRHAGMTAYDTNYQVIQDFDTDLDYENVYIANGLTGIDALAGAPLAAQTKSPIVLTDGKSVPAASTFVYNKTNANSIFTALGGEAVVPESVRVGINPTPTPSSTHLQAEKQSMLDLINQERSNARVAPLEFEEKLQKMAQAKSDEMVAKSYFDHVSPTYGSPFEMMKTFGISYQSAGENLAGNVSVEAAHSALMNSPGHKANILNTSYSYIGIGITIGPHGLIISQVFTN